MTDNPGMIRRASVAVAAYTIVLLVLAIAYHPTPLYSVETDLTGEYIPAARALAAGTLLPEHLSYHGPGYPMLLVAVAPLVGGDYFLAARVLTAVATGLAAWLAFLMVMEFGGAAVAALTLAGLILNPALLRYGVEAGTDAPALAIALFATWCVLRPSGRWALLAGGLAAGCAVVIRYNMLFLIPAAAIALLLQPDRRRLAWYAAGAALPVGAWLWVNAHLTGDAFHNTNYLNIAFELYGRDLPWDRFEAEIGSKFHSLADVIAFDPGHALLRVAKNVCVHFGRDLVELTPVWLGWLAVPGLFLVVGRKEWRPALIHFAICTLALAPVFYSPRFGLYLLPFYLACAAALVVALPELLASWLPRFPAASLRSGVRVVGAAMLVVSGVVAGLRLERHLADAPHEVRAAGRVLARLGLPGERIMARKPHVAYFAGMRHVPMGLTESLTDLVRQARAAHARYLFYSPIEQVMRPEYALLSDSGLSLPGLPQIAYGRIAENHFYAIYRIDQVVDEATMNAAIEPELMKYADRHRDEPDAQLFAAVQLINAERYPEALSRLLVLQKSGIKHPAVASLASTAYYGLGDYEQSYRECVLAMQQGPATAWHYSRLGSAREMQKRYAEALEWYERAVKSEPGNPRHLEKVGLAHIQLGAFGPAAAAFSRCATLEPRNATVRRYAIGAYQLKGDLRSARRMLEDGVKAGIPLPMLLDPDAAGGSSTETQASLAPPSPPAPGPVPRTVGPR